MSLTGAFVIAAFGLNAKWKGITQMYSLHSWLGFTFVVIFGVQVIFNFSCLSLIPLLCSVVYRYYIISLITGTPVNASQINPISPYNGHHYHHCHRHHCRHWHQREDDLQQGVQAAQCRYNAGQFRRAGDNDCRPGRHLHSDQARVQADRATQVEIRIS